MTIVNLKIPVLGPPWVGPTGSNCESKSFREPLKHKKFRQNRSSRLGMQKGHTNINLCINI